MHGRCFLQYLLQQIQHVFMGDFFNSAGTVFFRKVFVNRTVILHAVEVVGRMADAVKVTAEADMVIIAHEVQHIVDMAVNAFDAGIVVIVLQKLTGKVTPMRPSFSLIAKICLSSRLRGCGHRALALE